MIHRLLLVVSSRAFGRETRRRQPLSRPLRRARLRRRLLGIAFGLLAGFCLAELIAQFGAGWFYHGSRPWLGGIIIGLLASLALSIGRSMVRQVRIQLAASRAGYLSLILLGLGLMLVHPSPAAAQTVADCQVFVSQGGSAAVSMTDTSSGSPLEVDPANPAPFRIEWRIPGDNDQGQRDLTMVLLVNSIGRANVVHEALGGQTRGVYFLEPTKIDVPPGVYKVSGELRSGAEAVCASQAGFVRILGSPWSSRHGLIAGGGLLLGLVGVGIVFRFPRFDLWTFTSPDGVTVDIVDSKTGKTVRGPLLRGKMYVARTTIDFPDPASSYSLMPGPVDVTVGALTSTGSLATSTMNPSIGQTSVENAFTVPPVGETMELITDVSVAGNIVESVRVIEQLGATAERTRVTTAVGQVIYKAAGWAAADLCSMRPTDATIMLHGNADGTAVEAWTYSSDVATGRRTGRHRIGVDAFSDLSATCRQEIERCIQAGWMFANDETASSSTLEADRDDAVRLLAAAGATLRAELLGSADMVAPFDGVVLVAHDTEVTGSSTFPWPVLYEGPEPHAESAICFERHPDGPADHDDGVVCVGRFWGLSYEVAWPNGWVPTHGISERPGLALIRRILRRSPKPFSVNILRNRESVVVYSVDNVEFGNEGGIEAELPNGVTMSRTLGQAAFARGFDELRREAEIVHLFGHGHTGDDDFALALDGPGEQLLDGSGLHRLADAETFERGPIVFLNACQSGAVALRARNGLVDALRTLGARAVVVTESRVDADEAIATLGRALRDVLAGEYVSRAVRSARRESMYQESDMSSLSFTYYGPCGLRLSNPTIDLASASVPSMEERHGTPSHA